MAYKNVIDDSSTTVSANTPGVTIDLTQFSTLTRASLGVPCRFRVAAASTGAGDTGTVKLLDANGAAVITVPITGSTEAWYTTDAFLPATSAKYDIHYGGNTSSTLTVYAASLYPLSFGVDTGTLSKTLGAVTLSATGINIDTGVSTPTLGALTLSATGTVVSPLPTFSQAGTIVNTAGTDATVAWPTHTTNDYAILVVGMRNTTSTDPGAASLTTANGFTAIGSGSILSSSGTVRVRITVFECRATSSSMASPVVTGVATAVTNAVILTYAGCTTSGSAVDVISTSASNASNSSFSVSGATTTGANRLVAIFETDDSATATIGVVTNTDLASITERLDAIGSRHMSSMTGTKAATGAYGSSTATLSASCVWTGVTVALKG